MMSERSQKLWILYLIPLLLYLAPLGVTPLMEPDEGRYSAIPQAMNQSGDYITPRLKQAVYFEKPPLSYWATALSFRLFGENEFASRLFAALCAWGCVLLVYRMGLHFHDRRTGLYSAAVMSTFLFHAAIGRINILDMPLACFVCLAIWSGYRYFADPSGQRSKHRLYLLYLHSGLAFLTKGLIGIAFPFGVVILWLLISRRWREMLQIVSPIGMTLFAAMTMPWLLLVQQANPDFFRFFFIQEHLLRYTTRMHDRYQPFYFYLPILLAGTLPWCGLLPEALKGLRGRLSQLFSREETLFLSTWFFLILGFFSLSSSKLIPYIAPLFVPLALIFGHTIRRLEDQDDTQGPALGRGVVFAALPAVLFLTVLFAPLFLGDKRMAWEDWWPWIIVPAVLLMAMVVLPAALRRKGLKPFWPLYGTFSLFLLTVTLPVAHYLTPYKSARPVAEAIRTLVPMGSPCYQFGMSLYGIDFYNRSRTPIVDDIGEVRYGSEHLPAEERDRYFLTGPRFFEEVRRQKVLFCATEAGERLADLKKEFPDMTILWHNSSYYLLKLTVP